ncbi:hypothetical protein BRARA_E02503 [Brassica rapa]|uniref:Uncharacterized protein n=2 Tax=Brassica TaxID=3705 RepID=A0A397ZCX3_BRACM|nr:hypothetical protein BRARA_E02503 [Brassica rapa]CAF2101049.1 unnamed protein product [Brassica napus]CAG7877388.1 unnamed protein product [Brassica rapa]
MSKNYAFLLLYLLLQNEARDKVDVLDLIRKKTKQQKQRFLKDGLKKITSKSANVIKGVLWHTGLSQAKERN